MRNASTGVPFSFLRLDLRCYAELVIGVVQHIVGHVCFGVGDRYYRSAVQFLAEVVPCEVGGKAWESRFAHQFLERELVGLHQQS